MYMNEISVMSMAQEDAKYIADRLMQKHTVVDVKDITATKVSDAAVDAEEVEYDVQIVLDIDSDQQVVNFQYYLQPDGNVELSDDLDNVIQSVDSRIMSGQNTSDLQIITAADDFDSDNFDDDDFDEISHEPVEDDTVADDDSITDTLNDMSEQLDDLQDDITDPSNEDDINIDINNNIDNHYIAECEKCHGIFISSLIASDQRVESIHGVCPLCDKESDQYLKWIVEAVEQ